MKRLILLFWLCYLTTTVYSQKSSTTFNLFGGAGLAENYNYDAAVSGGLSFVKGVRPHVAFGAEVLYQNYELSYDRESKPTIYTSAGAAGMTILNKSSYVFVSPEFVFDLVRKGFLKAYVTGGVGFLISGTETMAKWDNSYNSWLPTNQNYDSVIKTDKNINSMLYRFSFGLQQFAHIGGHMFFMFKEDVGCFSGSISTTGSPADASRTPYSPANGLTPVYFSFQIGLAYHRNAQTRR